MLTLTSPCAQIRQGTLRCLKAAACSTASANSVYLTIFLLQASSAESSHGTVSPIKYSICCVSDHSTKSALRLFPTGLSAVCSSLFSSLWLTHSWTAVAGQKKSPHSHVFALYDKTSAGVLTFKHRLNILCSKSWAAVSYTLCICYTRWLLPTLKALHSLLYLPYINPAVVMSSNCVC